MIPPRTLRLWVDGHPQAQGSKRLVGGRLIEAAPLLRQWRNTVHLLAQAEIAGLKPPALEGPCGCRLEFRMPRPARPTWPYPTRGDLDKLVRAVLDSLTTAGWWADDKHLTHLQARKRWANPDPGVDITAWQLPPTGP
jgi:Holliday junction resolvase RusA-like endonuclease